MAASLEIKGSFVKSQNKQQPLELLVNNPETHKVTIYGKNTDPKNYLLKKRVNFEKLRDYLHLRPKSSYIQAMSRVRNSLAFATHMFF